MMKRTIMTCLMAVGVWLTALAANTVTLTTAQGHPGDEVEVAVMLNNTDQVTALEVLVPLSDALHYVDGSATLNVARSNGHTLSAAAEDGKLTICIYSVSLASLKGSEGEVCRFKVRLDKDPADYALVPEVVMSDASGKSITTSIVNGKVTLLSPKIEVTTPTIDYGRVPIRSTHTKTLTVKNVGNKPLDITGLTLGNSDFTASPATCTVAAGSTQNITLSYAPMLRGTVESTVIINSNAINPIAAKAVIKAQPYSVNELHVQRAEGVSDEEVTIMLKMNNMEPITGAQVSFTLPDQLVFVEGSTKVGALCKGTNHMAMGSVNEKVLTMFLYSPTNAVIPEGNGELMTFKVRLNGTSGSYKLTPTDVVLSNVDMENMVSATSANYVVINSPKMSAANTIKMGASSVVEKALATYSIYNGGKVDLEINRVAFLDEGYAVEEELPISVAPGKTKVITISYTAKTEGDHETTMQIYTNDPTSRMKSVAVSGNVYEPNHILVNGVNTETGYHVSFGLDNYTDIVALQMNVHWLPEMSTSATAMHISERLKNHSRLITDLGGGVYQVLIYSINNKSIIGNSGELFSLDYMPTSGVTYRNTDIRVTDIVMSDAHGTNYASTSEVNAKAVFSYFTLRFVVEGKIISEQLVKVGTPIYAPEIVEREGYTLTWDGIPQTMPSNDLTINGSYTEKWYDFTMYIEGELYLSFSVPYGMSFDSFDVMDAPEKEGHTFLGWKGIPITMPAKAVEIHGSYSVNSYKIIYKVDGAVYKTETIPYGSSITPEIPIKEGYTFSGWSGVPKTMPAKDISVTGYFMEKSYTITYVVDGSVYKTENAKYGSIVTTIATPVKEGYTFSGWSDVPSSMPANDIIITGSFSVNSYKITYKVDGAVYKTETIPYGSSVTPEIPIKEGYTFSGWSGVPKTMPAKDIVISGSFSTNSYLITYKVDGEVYKTESLAYGNKITVITAPVKDGYTFSGWSDVPSTMPANDIIITGSFSVNSYKVTYKIDGRVYSTQSIAYGNKITAIPEPSKEGYIFGGWNGLPSTMPARNVTVTGTFYVNNYVITYEVDGEVYKTENIAFGSLVTAIDAPVKEGYTFSGWSGVPRTMPARNVTVTGTFSVNTYNVVFVLDGIVLAEYALTYGSSIDVPQVPEKAGLTFSGWGKVPETMPASDLRFEGSYITTPYAIIYMVDGVEYYRALVEYGSIIKLIDTPVREGYTFSGWSTPPTRMPAHDVTVSGSFTVNSYTVTYYIDGDVYYTKKVPYGSSLTAVEEPVKEGYTFSGWSEIPNTMPANDVTVEGAFTVNRYTISYYIDGDMFSQETIEFGTPIVAMEAPSKDGYTFSGWSGLPSTMPANDIIVNGLYKKNSYTITYIVDGQIYKTESIAYGNKVTAIAAPVKEGNTFSGWSGLPSTMPANNVTVTGTFSVNSYTITYVVDGEVYLTETVKYGTEIVLPDDPVKEGYAFAGWVDAPTTMPAGDITINGSFAKSSYTITYIVDGKIYKTESIAYGNKVTAIAAPVKEGHTFSGWSGLPGTMPANNVTVTGTFSVNSYTITYVVDGEVYLTETVKYGTEIVLPDDPVKEGYAFAGWGDVPTTMPANDITINGSFVIGVYTVTYIVDGEVYKVYQVKYGEAIPNAETPVKEGYTFNGWNEAPKIMPARNVTINGSFTINKYFVTFVIDGEVIASLYLEYGAEIVVPEAPEMVGYTFDGWHGMAETVPAHDVTYEGSYTANVYTVYYYVGDVLVHFVEVTYGETIPEYVYEPETGVFMGWIGEVYLTMPAHDVVYTANIDNSIDLSVVSDQQPIIVYDLGGRRIPHVDNLDSGTYIINGRVVMIK